MSDRNLVACNEDHEMKTILKKFKKSVASENVEILRKFCKEFKADASYAPRNRQSFYKYIEDKKVLNKLK